VTDAYHGADLKVLQETRATAIGEAEEISAHQAHAQVGTIILTLATRPVGVVDVQQLVIMMRQRVE